MSLRLILPQRDHLASRGGWRTGSTLLVVLFGLSVSCRAAQTGGAASIAATKGGDLQQVQHLLGQGVAPDAHDAVRHTALIFAARDVPPP